MNIYNSSGTLLSQGTNASGDGTEQWYQSDVSYTFQSGQTYTISFYTDRAESSLFDRKNSASGGYSVDGLVSNVYSRSGLNSSGGDNGSEAYPKFLVAISALTCCRIKLSNYWDSSCPAQ